MFLKVRVTQSLALSSKDSGYVDNWQKGKTVTECNLHMLTTEECSDVTFRVGSEKHMIRAHRYVLVSRSCVFHAMFCGPLAEKGEVTIPDIEPVVFKVFLRYLYSDTVDITANIVTGLLYTSRKYAVDCLQKQCLTYLENSLTEDTVCTVLEQCHYYGETDLEEKALKILVEAGTNIMKGEGIRKLCFNCLGSFLKSDQLRMSEEDVFTITMSWAVGECEKQEVETCPQNVRWVLGDFRHEIRFSLMAQKFLVKTVGPSGILSSEERLLIMDACACPDVDVSPFKSLPRKGPLMIFQRFTSVSQQQWSYEGYPDAISFSVSKNVQLLGFQLYGPCETKYSVYSLTSDLFDSNTLLRDYSISLRNCNLLGGENTNDIFLPAPVPLTSGVRYTLQVTLKGPKSFTGSIGIDSREAHGVLVKFYNNNSMSKNGTGLAQGQIPGLIFQ